MTAPATPADAAWPPSGAPPRRLAVLGCAVLETEIEHFADKLRDRHDAPEIVALNKLEQGLHNEPPRLRTELQKAIHGVEREAAPDAIVLGYGLCSRGVDGLFARRATIVIPRAHDCITVLLGGRDRYADYVAQNPGTYWYSPGWNRHHTPPGKERYDKLYAKYVEDFGEDNAAFLMEQEQHWFTTYDRATYVHLTVGASDEDKKYTQKCADWLEWNYDEQAGDPQLLIDLLAGNWDAERFVVVPPGHRLKMTGDEDILRSEPMTANELREQDPSKNEEVSR